MSEDNTDHRIAELYEARYRSERALADDLAADVERLQAKLNRALDELAYHGCVAEHRYERDLPALARYRETRQR